MKARLLASSFRLLCLVFLCIHSLPLTGTQGHAISGLLFPSGRYREKTNGDPVLTRMIPFKGRWLFDPSESTKGACPETDEIVVYPTIERQDTIRAPFGMSFEPRGRPFLKILKWDTKSNAVGNKWGYFTLYGDLAVATHETRCDGRHVKKTESLDGYKRGDFLSSFFFGDSLTGRVPTLYSKEVQNCSIESVSDRDDTWTRLTVTYQFLQRPAYKPWRRYNIKSQHCLRMSVNSSRTKLEVENVTQDGKKVECRFRKRSTF